MYSILSGPHNSGKCLPGQGPEPRMWLLRCVRSMLAVASIESCMHKVTGTIPTDLSEQHLMDCAYNSYNGANKGCEGGYPDLYHNWMYTSHNGGLANGLDYPYVRDKTQYQCRNSTIPIADHGALVG